MTVSTILNRVSNAGNGVTTVFSFPNKFLADADLVVLDVLDSTGVETTKTLTTHYTVSGAGDAAGGSVTMLIAPAVGHTLVIYRDPALTQPIDLVNGDLLDVDTGIERGMDRSTLQMQRLRDLMDRSLRLPDGDTGFVAGDMILPAEIDRVGNYLAFDADGKPIASAGTTGTVPVSAFMETVVDDTTAGAVVETLRGSLSAETVTADDDEVLLRDTSATAGKRMTFSNFIDRILTVARTFTAAHVHQGAETFVTLAISGALSSTKAAASGYSRVTPNMCRVNVIPAYTVLVRDTGTEVLGPTGCKGLIISLANYAKSANSVTGRQSRTDVYSEVGLANVIASANSSAYEHVAVGAGTTLSYNISEVHVKTTADYKVWLKFADDAGNSGSADYAIVGYYD